MKYIINDEKYEVEIIKKNNKNSYIRYKDGKIVVTTSYLASKGYIMDLIKRNEQEILNMINKIKLKDEKQEQFYFLGKKLNIIKVSSLDKVILDENNIYIKDDNQLDKFLKAETLKIFNERLKISFDMFEEDIPYPSLRIRKMKTRWGVCNRKTKMVTLNYMLNRYDIKHIDYVIIHELAHFVFFDHSKNFWNLVLKYMPDYKIVRKDLR